MHVNARNIGWRCTFSSILYPIIYTPLGWYEITREADGSTRWHLVRRYVAQR